MAKRIVVSLPGERDYSVRVGSGVLDALGTDLRKTDCLATVQRALIITDSNVAPLYLARAKQALSAAGFKVADISVPAGEASKSLAVIEEIWRAMAQLSFGRDCVVVAR